MLDKKVVYYEGDWSDYYVDVENLNINEKIKRTLELDNIASEIKRKRKGSLSWISVPFILVALSTLLLLVNAIPIAILRYIVMFVLAAVSVIILAPIAIKPKNKVKFRWRKWILIVLIWLAALNGIKPPSVGSPYGILSLVTFVGIIFILSLIFMLIYTSLSRSGYDEMVAIAESEKEYLTREIYSKINSERLEPIRLDYDVILDKDEIPLIETESVLINAIPSSKYYSSRSGSSGIEKINISSWFNNGGKFGINKDKVIGDINNALPNVAAIFENVFNGSNQSGSFARESQQKYSIPDKNNIEYNDMIGTLVLTNERILFVGSSKGFQIFYTELTSCALSRTQKEVISFETTDMVRILATDFSYWIKLYVDRLARDARL